MTKDLFDKYIWLVDTIYRVGRITLAEINMRWMRSKFSDGEKIPRRTFNNWRIAIEQVFDITILCDRKDGYVYYIENAEDMEKGGSAQLVAQHFHRQQPHQREPSLEAAHTL